MNAYLEPSKNWLGRSSPKPKPEPVKRHYEFNVDCVIYIPLRCPVCRSIEVKFVSKDDRLRYHVCVCGHRFKSIEQEN
jgi:hypothetical protein